MTKRDKLNRLARAGSALIRAQNLLREISNDKSENHYLCEEARYYHNEIQNLLNADSGQAGLDALIDKVAREVNQ